MHNKFYKDVSISEGLSSKEITDFSDIEEHEDVAESIHKKIISNETELAQKIPYIINDENVVIVPG